MVATTSHDLSEHQHLVLDNVEWPFYEHALDQIGNGHIRVTFADGMIEFMAPLPEHEWINRAIGLLIELMAIELNISTCYFGSTTFRRSDRQVGLEPDDCYYIANTLKVRGMKRFDPAIHPAPDLAIEIDITSRSIPRQPIYAALGVPELWRHDGKHLSILILDRGVYKSSANSLAFPKLPIAKFESFVRRMESDEERIVVLRDFRQWVQSWAL